MCFIHQIVTLSLFSLAWSYTVKILMYKGEIGEGKYQAFRTSFSPPIQQYATLPSTLITYDHCNEGGKKCQCCDTVHYWLWHITVNNCTLHKKIQPVFWMDKKAGCYIWAFNCMQDVHLINHMYGIFILAVVYKPYGIRQCMIDKGVVW